MKKILSIFYLGFTLAFSPLYAAKESQEILIGIASNFSDVTSNSYNPFGNSVKNGAELAVQEVNKILKSKNIQIKLKQYNYGSDMLNVRRVVQEGNKDNLIAMVGYEYSDHALLAAPLHEELKFPMITPSASADRISVIGDYIFQGSFNNSYQIEMLARFSIQKLKAKRAAIVTALDCAYCQDVASSFERFFQQYGGKISKKVSILTQQKDFSLAFIPSDFKDVDVIMVPNQELTSARVITYLLNNGVNKIFLGGDGWRTLGDFHKTPQGERFLGYMMAHWQINQKTKASQAFVKSYKTKFKSDPTDSAVLAYDTLHFIGKALLEIQGGNYNRESLKNALRNLKQYSGATGQFIFKPNSAPQKSILLMKSSPKGFVIHKIIEPSEGASQLK